MNAADDKGYTALHGAAYLGNHEMIAYLIEKGADVKAVFGSEQAWPRSQPINYVTAQAPRMLLLAGQADRTVDPDNTMRLAKRLRAVGDTVQAEARIPRVVCDGLSRLGYNVNRRTLNYDSYFARPQVIVAGRDGQLSGGSDPRKDGGAAFDTETR